MTYYAFHTARYTQELINAGFCVYFEYIHGVKTCVAVKGEMKFAYIEVPELTGPPAYDIQLLNRCNEVKLELNKQKKVR